MQHDLVAYESGNGIDVNYRRFLMIARDLDRNAVGVINAFTAFPEIYVDDVWVDHFVTGKGYGRQLLQEA